MRPVVALLLVYALIGANASFQAPDKALTPPVSPRHGDHSAAASSSTPSHASPGPAPSTGLGAALRKKVIPFTSEAHIASVSLNNEGCSVGGCDSMATLVFLELTGRMVSPAGEGGLGLRGVTPYESMEDFAFGALLKTPGIYYVGVGDYNAKQKKMACDHWVVFEVVTTNIPGEEPFVYLYQAYKGGGKMYTLKDYMHAAKHQLAPSGDLPAIVSHLPMKASEMIGHLQAYIEGNAGVASYLWARDAHVTKPTALKLLAHAEKHVQAKKKKKTKLLRGSSGF